VVGSNCSGSASDVTAPENLTATVGNITSSSVQILLNATDDSGKVVYDVTYGATTQTINGDSGVQKALIISGLTAETLYSFSIQAKDLSGNVRSGNPINLEATTLVDTSSQCSGAESEAIQGSFSVGYNYEFSANGSDVTFTFEMLDTDRSAAVAYLWKENPFSETPMDKVSSNKFTKTVSGFTIGQTISYACKFAFDGGLAVTKYLTYKVGDNCTLSTENNILAQSVKVFPNPAKNTLNLSSPIKAITKVEVFSVIGKKVLTVKNNLEKINIEELSSGMYFIKISSDDANYTTKFIKE
jgi:hypothetical protein